MLDVFASLFGPYPFRNEKYGIRITEITSRADRLRGIS
jgi:hypothetical protein